MQSQDDLFRSLLPSMQPCQPQPFLDTWESLHVFLNRHISGPRQDMWNPRKKEVGMFFSDLSLLTRLPH